MKIEVGDYVRTRAGHFYKITRIDENGLIYWNKIQCGWSMEQLKDIVVKHSKNIIDLVEVGDYVNGYKVRGKTEKKVVVDYYCYSEELAEGNWLMFFKDNIKTIVTHEQMQSIEYKLEEDK